MRRSDAVSSRLEDIASAAEVITGKPADVYCDENTYADVVQEETQSYIRLGSVSLHEEECEIHALGSLMHSPIDHREVSRQAGSLAGNLFAVLEHNRIDRITSSWYDRDMIAASAKNMKYIAVSSNMLTQELLGMLYGKPMSGKFPVLEKYRQNIEAAIKSSSPVKALETAIAIAHEEESISESLSQVNSASESPEPQRNPEMQEYPVKVEIRKAVQDIAETIVNDGEKEELKGKGHHQYRIWSPQMVPFKGMDYCSYILKQWVGSKPLYRTAIQGAPRYNVWSINYGKTKVFNKRIVSAGKVIVLVDLSGSMDGFWDDGDAGYLAFQAANLIAGGAGGSEVDLYGFTGSFSENVIVPLKAGYVPQGTRYRYSHDSPLLGLTPMCVALEFLSAVYQGAEASIAVLITDGSPSEAYSLSQDHVMKHTKDIAYSLYEAGMRYLLIQVNTEGLERLYPAEITVHVSSQEDLLQIPPAMSAMVCQ